MTRRQDFLNDFYGCSTTLDVASKYMAAIRRATNDLSAEEGHPGLLAPAVIIACYGTIVTILAGISDKKDRLEALRPVIKNLLKDVEAEVARGGGVVFLTNKDLH